MSLSDKLVFFAPMGATNPPWLQTDYVAGRNLSAPTGASAVPGQFGKVATHLDYTIPQSLKANDAYPFRVQGPFTIGIRVKFTKLDTAQLLHAIVKKGSAVVGGTFRDYEVYAVYGGSTWNIAGALRITGFNFDGSLNVQDSTSIVVGQSYYIAMTWDGVGTLSLSVDAGSQATASRDGTPTVNAQPLYVGLGAPDQSPKFPLDADIQDLSIWRRVLSQDELARLTDGEGPLDAITEDCKAVTCCQEVIPTYDASNPTPSGASNSADLCDPVPVVTIDPVSGSTVTFPTYVFLNVSRPDAVIHYTTDGTTPTIASPIYTAPFQITASVQIVQAFSIVAGCQSGPIAIAQYVESANVFKYGFSCDTTDKVGQWGQFTPNGVIDYHWTLQIKLPNLTVIKRMEVYQTNPLGVWLSGQAWSTDEFINPKEGPPNFHVFPLGVFDDGLSPNVAFAFTNQLNNAYLATFKTLANQQYLWTLIGQRNAPLNGFFKLLIFLGDGTIMESIIPITCGDPPPPCHGPAAPTLTPVCSGIDIVTTANTDGSSIIGKSFTLFRAIKDPCGDGVYRTWATGIIASNPQTFHDTGLTDGCTYCYALQVDEGGACGLRTSPTACAQPLCLPKVHISLDIHSVCSCKLVTITWSSSCTTGNITITDSHGNTIYSGAGNTQGTAQVTVCVDTQFTITGSNSCGTVTASDAVLAQPLATCPSTDPEPVRIVGWFDTFLVLDGCDIFQLPYNELHGTSAASWTGIMQNTGPCTWNAVLPAGLNLGYFTPAGSPQLRIDLLQGSISFGILSNEPHPVWILQIIGYLYVGGNPSGGVPLWVGIKKCGNSPIGTYQKIDAINCPSCALGSGGCASNSTIDVSG